MADLTITAASVIAGSDANTESGTAGATITAGQAVYKSSTSKKWLLADNDSATAEVRQMGGIALNGASDGQPIVVHKSGDLTIGATLTAGTAYYLSATPGGICPLADVASGDYVVQVGLAKSTSVIDVDIQYTGVAL